MPGVFVMRFNNVTRKYFFVMDTKLIKNLMPVVLFHDESFNVTQTVRLNQSSANFKRLEILYRTNVGNYDMNPTNVNYHSTTVYNPNGKRISLFSTAMFDNSEDVYLGFKEIYINGTEIRTHNTSLYHSARIKITKDPILLKGDFVGITTVLGFYA